MSGSSMIIGLLVYVGILMFFGWYIPRKQSGAEDFLLGGRELPFILVFGSTMATMVGTGSTMGAVGNAYSNGWAGVLVGLGGALGFFLLTYLFVDARNENFVTETEELASYYQNNKMLKIVIAIMLTLASIGWLGAHLLGGSSYLAHITGIDMNLARVIMAFTFAIYIVLGGYLAVVWTDTIQAFILFFGFIAMAILSYLKVGGIEGIRAAVPAENLSFLGIDKIGLIPAISTIIAIATSPLAVPSFRQRIYSAKDTQTARRGFLTTSVAFLLFAITPAIVGISAFAINPEISNANFVFPYMATSVFPPFIGLAILICGMSATISSGDSDAMTGVTIIVTDVYQLITGKALPADKVVNISKIMAFVVVGVALIFIWFANDILGYIQTMIATLLTGVAVAGIFGRFWKRATWQGALSAIIMASLTSFYISGNKDLNSFWGGPIIPAWIISSLTLVVVSLLTPVPSRSRQEILQEINSERQGMGL
ncbi:MAG: sodium:solute symporter family protein [Brevinema sp.]